MAIDFTKPDPLYRQIADSIREDIQSGQLKKGDRLGSHKELIDQFGVSLITVKRALSELINEGLLYSRMGKGTYVFGKTQSETPAKLKTIGLVLRDFKSPFFSLIVHGVESYASTRGYNLLLANSAGQITKEETQIRNFYGTGVSGLVIASMTHEYQVTGYLRKIHEEGYPYVMVSFVKDLDIFFVGTDHEAGGYLATEHLVKLGYTTIGYINGESGNAVGELRYAGYRRALSDYAIDYAEKFHFHLRQRGEWNDFNSGVELGERFITLKERPEALFIYNDLAALGFQQAILAKGFVIPLDVAIVGFDGIERGSYAPVPITTVQQPALEIGALAVETLIKRIDCQEAQHRTILKPQLIVRESCGAAARKYNDG